MRVFLAGTASRKWVFNANISSWAEHEEQDNRKYIPFTECSSRERERERERESRMVI
jgi:hypothetical protein